MTLHLVKLCVGCDTLQELADWQAHRLREAARLGAAPELSHVTRQTPRRAEFQPGSSSIYWVIGGLIRARQNILALREVEGGDGISRCALILCPTLVATEPAPRRAFQGWRYLSQSDAPSDLDRARANKDAAAIPPAMHAALVELRLI